MEYKLISIYDKLSKAFGPQHWWPGDSSFEVMVGAILTQNTNWVNVEKAIVNLKEEKLLDAKKLYKLPEKKLAKLIRPAGYYNVKAKRLKNFLRFFLESYRGNIRAMKKADLDILRRQLLNVNGIGPETADSILLYALEKNIFVVDAYTKRVFSRHRIIKEDAGYHEVQEIFMRLVNCAGKSACKSISGWVRLFNEYHALIVRLAKEFCLKNKPKCGLCPLRGIA
ncbi:MAG: endonuclease III domain-containing protein [Candidatus Omnitrophica bacterium]|nr:endonuclease III domain-containing protein [Candidatus Omnitrophota bacterium]